MPRTGGELSAVLTELIRVLRFVGDFDRPGRPEGIAELVRRWRKGLHEQPILDSPIPKPLAAGVACRALMAVEVQLQSDVAPVRVQPLGRKRRRLVPLIFANVHPRDLGYSIQGLDQLAAAAKGDGDRAVQQALESLASRPDDIERWGSMALRVVGLLGIGWNEDAELLAAKLDLPLDPRTATGVVLSQVELAAYERLATGFVATWHQRDELEALLYAT